MGTDIKAISSDGTILHQNTILEAINRILREALTCDSEEQLGALCLSVAEHLTQSSFGFIGKIGPDGNLHDISISESGWKQCSMYDQTGDRKPPVDLKLHGLYGRILLDGKSLLTNNPSSHPDSIGLPEGHPPLMSFLGVPLLHNRKTIGVIALGNREEGYTPIQQHTIEAITPAIVQILFLKRAEEALRESEERSRDRAARLQAILDAAPTIIWTAHDHECRSITGNREAARFSRVSENTNLSKTGPTADRLAHYRVFKDGVELKPEKMPIQRVAASGKPLLNYAFDFVFDDGTIRTLLGNIVPVLDCSGQPNGAIAAFIDITERKRAEEKLRRAYGLIEGITRGTKDLIAAQDSNFRFLFFNDAYRREFKRFWGQEIKVGTSMLEALAPWPDDQRKARELWSRALEGESFSIISKFGPSKQEDQIYDISFNPVLGDQGRRIGAAHILRNVTEQVTVREELRKARDELDMRVQERTAAVTLSKRALEEHVAKLGRLNKELEEFSWIAAHDLQEPLRKIQTFGDRLQKLNHSLDKNSQEDLQRIIKSANRMSSLIHAVRSYSDVTQRGHYFEPTELSAVIEEAVSDLEVVIKNTGARVEVSELPLLEAERTGMRQLFQNLIQNAIKYARSDVKPLVLIFCDPLEGRCRINVEDNGIGFNEKYMDQIFRPFKRLHGKTSRYEGIGMGLAICRKVVELHGGTITARSTPGEGSTFIVTLPLKQGKSSSLQA